MIYHFLNSSLTSIKYSITKIGMNIYLKNYMFADLCKILQNHFELFLFAYICNNEIEKTFINFWN